MTAPLLHLEWYARAGPALSALGVPLYAFGEAESSGPYATYQAVSGPLRRTFDASGDTLVLQVNVSVPDSLPDAYERLAQAFACLDGLAATQRLTAPRPLTTPGDTFITMTADYVSIHCPP